MLAQRPEVAARLTRSIMERLPFSLEGIDHIVLRVADVRRAVRFYCDVLGCALEREQPELGLTQLRAGRNLIDLVTLDGPLGAGEPPGAGRNLEHFCVTLEPYGAQGEGRSFFISDPEGNHIELKAARR
jgi:glyoxylase I family protein